MGMHVYEVCKGLKLLAEGVNGIAWWIDPKTGHRLENATYIHGHEEARRGHSPDELKGSSIYTYELRLEYSLELGCQGRGLARRLSGHGWLRPEQAGRLPRRRSLH